MLKAGCVASGNIKYVLLIHEAEPIWILAQFIEKAPESTWGFFVKQITRPT
jgi:hypothetical protein